MKKTLKIFNHSGKICKHCNCGRKEKMEKIKIASVKFAHFASGGTEKFLQTIIANLPKDKFEVDAYYTNAAPYLGSDFKHPDNDQCNIEYVKKYGVNVIPVSVEYKDVRVPNHEWVNTDFYEKFNESKYDILLTARAGHSEKPYCDIHNIPIVELVTLPGMADRQSNIVKSIHISNFQLQTWINVGGDPVKAEVIPLFSDTLQTTNESFRQELKISENDFVFGMHQRVDDGIFSSVPLEAYKKISKNNVWFVVMGGSELYSKFAQINNITNFIQLPHSSDKKIISKFLNTLNCFSGGRRDGETFGNVYAEAMSFGLPCIGHIAPAIGHIETIGDAGKVCSSIDEYTNYMLRILNDKEFYLTLSKNAKNRYNNYLSPNVNMDKVIKIFDDIMKEKNKDKMSDEDFWSSF